MQIILLAMKERQNFVDYLVDRLPKVRVCYDEKRSAMDTYFRGIRMSQDDPAIFLEEDIILTENFEEKANKVISYFPNNIINFFSIRPTDVQKGSRWDGWFSMNQCFYLPKGYGSQLIDFYNGYWTDINYDGNRPTSAKDSMMRKWMQLRKEKYWLHCPSLVQHRETVSMIDSRRSRRRISHTFEEK